jgi:hypothetical protein
MLILYVWCGLSATLSASCLYSMQQAWKPGDLSQWLWCLISKHVLAAQMTNADSQLGTVAPLTLLAT